MSGREDLPARRGGVIVRTCFGGAALPYRVTYGAFADGRIAEIFITPEKSGSDSEAIARDAAIILSVALQYGAPFARLRAAATRDAQGAPLTIIGHALDVVGGDVGAGDV